MARGSESRTRTLASVALLSAVAFILRIAVELPFPLAGYLKLEIWEIPAYLALFIYGIRRALSVAFIVFILVLAFATGPLPTGPLYNFIAVLSTFAGVIAVSSFTGKSIRELFKSRTMAIVSVLSSSLARIMLMTVVNAIILPLPFPIGFKIPPEAVPPILVVTAIFNGTVALYSTAIAIAIASRITPSITGIPSDKA